MWEASANPYHALSLRQSTCVNSLTSRPTYTTVFLDVSAISVRQKRLARAHAGGDKDKRPRLEFLQQARDVIPKLLVADAISNGIAGPFAFPKAASVRGDDPEPVRLAKTQQDRVVHAG